MNGQSLSWFVLLWGLAFGIIFKQRNYQKKPDSEGEAWSGMVYQTLTGVDSKIQCGAHCMAWAQGKCTAYIYEEASATCHLADVIFGGGGYLSSQSTQMPVYYDVEINQKMEFIKSKTIRLEDISLIAFANETFFLNETLSSATETNCMFRCFFAYNDSCNMLIQDSGDCHLGSINSGNAPNETIIANTGDVIVLIDVLNTSVAAYLDVTFDGSLWSTAIFKTRTLVTNHSMLECQAYCLYNSDQCGFSAWQGTDCYLGRFPLDSSMPPSSNVSLQVLANSAFLQNYTDYKFQSLENGPLAWRNYIHETRSNVENVIVCKVECIFDREEKCGYVVYENGNCHFGNVVNVNSTLTTAESGEEVHILQARHDILNKFSGRYDFSEAGLYKMFFAEYSHSNTTKEGCATVCFLSPDPCHFYQYYVDSSSSEKYCFLGRFGYNGTSPSVTYSYRNFKCIPAEYNSFKDSLEILMWRVDCAKNKVADHVYNRVTGIFSEWECSMKCLEEADQTCRFIAFSSYYKYCFFGNFDLGDNGYSLGSYSYTCKMGEALGRDTPSAKYVPITDLQPEVWPAFIRYKHTNISDSEHCAGMCVISIQCDLYYYATDELTCYLGVFNDNTTILGRTEGPFMAIQNYYDNFLDPILIDREFTSYWCVDNWRNVIYQKQTGLTRGFCALGCRYDDYKDKCSFFVYDSSNTCYYGNHNVTSPIAVSTAIKGQVHFLKSYDRHQEQYVDYTVNQDTYTGHWRYYVTGPRTEHECASICNMDASCHMFHLNIASGKCCIGSAGYMFDRNQYLMNATGHWKNENLATYNLEASTANATAHYSTGYCDDNGVTSVPQASSTTTFSMSPARNSDPKCLWFVKNSHGGNIRFNIVVNGLYCPSTTYSSSYHYFYWQFYSHTGTHTPRHAYLSYYNSTWKNEMPVIIPKGPVALFVMEIDSGCDFTMQLTISHVP